MNSQDLSAPQQRQGEDDDGSEYEDVIEERELEVEDESYVTGSDDDEYDEETTENYEEEEEEEQENLLSFSTFPLEALRGQHIMVVVAFNRFIAVGTNRGVVALVETSGMVVRMLNKHVNPISDVSCDAMEEHVGSSDKSGVVTVQNLYDEQGFYRKEFDVPIHSMALHPKYSRNEDRPIVVGGGDKVMLITKARILGHRKSTVLQERRGRVYLVRWCGPDLIAWASDRGVQLYSYTGRAMVQFVARPLDASRLEFYPCSLVWEAPRTLSWGWGDWVQVLHVYELRMEERLRWGTEFLSRTHRVEVMPAILPHTATEPCRVCGIAPFGPDRYLVLACTLEQEGYMKELEVRIVERATFVNVFRGRLHTKYKHPLQYSLTFSAGGGSAAAVAATSTTASKVTPTSLLPSLLSASAALSESVFFIACVDAVIKVTPTDDDQHVEYLLKVGRFKEAYSYARTHSLRQHEAAGIGYHLLQHLFSEKKYDEVAASLPEVVKEDYLEWERWICQFDQDGMSDLLVDVLPIHSGSAGEKTAEDGKASQKNTRIGEEYYELVLLRCLEKDVLCFQRAVHKFRGMFRPQVVCNAAERHYNDWNMQGALGVIPDEKRKALGDTYGLLLQLGGHYDKALQVLLRVDNSDELFKLIRKEKLFAEAIEVLPALFARNEDRTIELLLEHVHPTDAAVDDATTTAALLSRSRFTPAAVVQRLERTQRRYLWAYLKALQSRDKAVYAALSETHAQLFATLFIENEPAGLLPFLRDNSAHLTKLREIFALCKKHQLLEEMVFLLARMGKEEEGLRIIVYDMKSVRKAVEFIADIPNAEDRLQLYKSLVQMSVEVNATLRSRNGQKYLEHRLTEGETWASIAQRYGVDEDDLRVANGAGKPQTGSGDSFMAPSSSYCIVPLNLTEALLRAIVDPSIAGRIALDPTQIVELLPEDEPIPHVGNCISDVARSKANDVRLMTAVVHVATSDLGKQYATLYRQREAAIRVEPGMAVCPFCHQPSLAGVVVFGCSHAYHANCVIGYLAGEGVLLVGPAGVDVGRFFKHPEEYLRADARQKSPCCLLCREVRGAVK
ncbi:putative vacuolar assembly protein vps41 [Trypanosoma conorhini]|uniref:Putative vacuolar assembly protein vps41 n=1 Tax=Trypanosoma conorhini TaxID=83891 RepID=A0A422PKN4_9TRYP|nr:putative vacuolar assembly protein vps41 [Trypanosoma conorhini]RNF18269.1 putative vacuolar assembly protein vps41 [Trypanosoma conorhini]